MKKVIMIFSLAIILSVNTGAQDINEMIKEKSEAYGIDNLQRDVPSDIKSYLRQFGLDDITPENVSGALSFEKILNFITMNFVDTLKTNSKLILNIAAVLLFIALFDALKNSYSDKNLSPVFNFAAGVIMCLILYKPLYDCAEASVYSIRSMSDFMTCLIPVMLTLMASSGQVATAAVYNSFLFTSTQIATSIAGNVLLPLSNIYIAVGIASCVSDNANLKGITDFMKKIINWGIGIVLTLFIGILSLQTVISSSTDTLSKRTLKFAVGSFLPVAGGMLSDAVDTFVSCVNILKSTTGIFGIIVLFFIIIMPIINTAINYFSVKISAFISTFFGNEKTTNLLNIIVDGFGIIMGLTASVSLMFFISLTLLILTGAAK